MYDLSVSSVLIFDLVLNENRQVISWVLEKKTCFEQDQGSSLTTAYRHLLFLDDINSLMILRP